MPTDTCQSCEPESACLPRASGTVRLVTLGTILLPLLGLVAAIVLLWQTPFHWIYLTLMGCMYVITVLGVGVGFHRLFTHKSFETSAAMRFIWAVLGSMSVEGPVIKWVAMHRKHHQFTDVPGDPHSPHGVHHDEHAQTAAKDVLRNVWHAHIGWAFDNDPPDLRRYAPDLEKDSMISFVS